MTPKNDEERISEIIKNNIDSLDFYTSAETSITCFQGNPELDMYFTNCRLFNGIPCNINIEIFDKKNKMNKELIRQKYNNDKDSVLILCFKNGNFNTKKFDGYVYSAFKIKDDSFSFFYKNPYVNSIVEKAGMGSEKIGWRNITCLNDIIKTNIDENMKKNSLFLLGELLQGYKINNKRLRHCFYEPSMSLIRTIFVEKKEAGEKLDKEYINFFIGNTDFKKSLVDKVLVSKLNNPKIINDKYFVILDKKAETNSINLKNYINNCVIVSSSKKDMSNPIIEIKKNE